MPQDIILTAAGLVALFIGGELLLRGAVQAARIAGLSELVIGLTVIGFGTSMPELLVSVKAALSNQPGIALGNVVGSNIANILLIGGAAALVFPPSRWDRSIRRDALVMVVASLVLLLLAVFGHLSRLAATGLVVLLIAYLWIAYRMGADQNGVPEHTEEPRPSLAATGAFLIAGFLMLFAGANWLVAGAVGLARVIGVSEAVIGLTIVAVGTSLPELATSMMAALRRKSDMALGNIVGSNIFNILGILGLTGMLSPFAIESTFLTFDIPLMIAAAVLFAAMLVWLKAISRWISAVMLAVYGLYTWSLFAV